MLRAASITARLIAAAALAGAVAGCTLPSEQLQLPGPVTGSLSKPQIERNNQRYGVPLSDPAHPAAHADRVYEGSGQFTGGPLPGQTANGSSPTKITEGSDGVSLNFVGANLTEVAQAVLGDILKLNYTVSDKIQTTITLRTPQPIAKDQLLGVLGVALGAQGIALTEQNGVYVIAPSDSAKNASAAPAWSKPGPQTSGVNGAHAITLRYVAATEMERIIQSVAPRTRILRVDSERNMLLVAGSPAELSSIGDTIKVFDVDWMRGMSVAILPVESGDPEAVAQELDTIFANDRESPTKGIIRFVPNKRLKSVLAISSRPEYVRKAEKWMRRIDIAGQATEKQVHVYHVQNRPAAELAELLQKVYAGQPDRRQEQTAPTEPGRETSVLSTPAEQVVLPAQGARPIPQIVSGTGATARPLASDPNAATTALDASAVTPPGAVAQSATGRELAAGDDRASAISVVADVPNNSLVITATHEEYRRIRQILARIDIAPNQVLLEATIAEVTLNDRLQYGLKWYFQAKASEFTFTDSVVGAVAPSFPGFSYFLNMANVQVALDALSRVTDVNVVSSPSLTVLDNKKAVLQIGDEVPIATQSAVSVISPGAPIVNSIAFRNTGVILGITPRISDNGRVLLDIEQEVSDVIPTTTSNLDSPTIQQRRIRTTVAVGDGESIVLAGLMQDRNDVTRSQVPLLGDIPVVGNMFKTKDNQIRRTELLIALTPHILKDPNQIRAVAAEFRDRMNFTTRPQRAGPPDRRENWDRLIVR